MYVLLRRSSLIHKNQPIDGTFLDDVAAARYYATGATHSKASLKLAPSESRSLSSGLVLEGYLVLPCSAVLLLLCS